jgi:hypothetical protein
MGLWLGIRTMDRQSIVLYMNMKGLSPIDIYRDLVATLGMNILGDSTVTRWVRGQSCCPPNESNEIQDQNPPIDGVHDAIRQAPADETCPQGEN